MYRDTFSAPPAPGGVAHVMRNSLSAPCSLWKADFWGVSAQIFQQTAPQVPPRGWRWVQGGVFSCLLQWFLDQWVIPLLCPLPPAPLPLERCVPWLRACSFLCLPTRAALYELLCIVSLLGALEPDAVPAAGAELPVMVGDRRGTRAPQKGNWGCCLIYFRCCLETNSILPNSARSAVQNSLHKGKRGVFYYYFYYYFLLFLLSQEVTHFSAVGEGSNWSRALQLAFRNGFILNVGIKLC